jgi:hypothetical protein
MSLTKTQELEQNLATLKARLFDTQEALTQSQGQSQALVELVVDSLSLEVTSIEEFVEAVKAFKPVEAEVEPEATISVS